MDTSPKLSPWQGAAQLAHALLAGTMLNDIRGEQSQAALDAMSQDRARVGLPPIEQPQQPTLGQRIGKILNFGGGQEEQTRPTDATSNTSAPDGSKYARAIAGIESGGKYDALGPITKSGDRAFGLHQIMGRNIGPWTKETIGAEMTPQQFLTNPQAQDDVFKAKFGQYVQKYGPDGAARAWFAGEGGMNNPNARDQLGTSVSDYAKKFNAYPSGPDISTAGLGGNQAATQSNITPPGGVQWPGERPPAAPAQTQQQPTGPYRIQNQIDPMVLSEIDRLSRPSGNPNIDRQNAIRRENLIKEATALREPSPSPLITPEQRAQYGIQSDDKRPYQWDQKTGLKEVGGSLVTVDQRAPSAFETEYGTAMGKRASAVLDAADKASTENQKISLIRSLNNSMQTGKLTPGIATIGAYLQSIGVDPQKVGIDPNLPYKAETLTALANEQMVGRLGPGGFPSQNFSDTDRKFMEKINVSGYDRPETNEMKLAIAERIQKLQMDKAEQWVNARDMGISFEKFDMAWRKKMKDTSVFSDLIAKMPPEQIQPPGSLNDRWPQHAPGRNLKFNLSTGRIE